MLDTKRLLDQILGGGAQSGFGASRSDVRNTSGQQRSGGGLGDVLGNLTNEQLIGAGGLAAILLGSKGGRGMGTSALKLGGLAAIASMAYKAYQNYQAGQQPGSAAPASVPGSSAGSPALPSPQGTPFHPENEAEQQSLARNLLRAMISAAKADGAVDASEQSRIFAQMDKLQLAPDDKAFVIDELRAPVDVDAVARSATTPEQAAEIYTASLLAIDVDSAAERGYLDLLASRLKLDDALVKHLQATVKGVTQA